VTSIPAVTAGQMREVDRIMTEDLGIDLVRMMENAGRNLAGLARDRYRPATVTVLAGAGGNGGGGLVAARHLANRGVGAAVVLVRAIADMAPVPAGQARILGQMGVPEHDDPPAADLIIDAVLGYSIEGDLRGRAADLIRWAGSGTAPVLSLDVPSGLDATTGRAGDPCVTADATLTLALPKTGLLLAPERAGDLFLADISVPPSVYRAVGLEIGDPFGGGPVVPVS
jgi:NAD(P)H-hydrate epimerase